MGHDIDKLLRLTHEMSDALDRDALDHCTSLLTERGILLQSLTAQYGNGDDAAMPDDMREALATVRSLDGILTEKLSDAMSRIGRQIGDLKAKTRHISSGNSPVCINRHV